MYNGAFLYNWAEYGCKWAHREVICPSPVGHPPNVSSKLGLDTWLSCACTMLAREYRYINIFKGIKNFFISLVYYINITKYVVRLAFYTKNN